MTFLAVVGWVLFACAVGVPAIRRHRGPVHMVGGVILPRPDDAGWRMVESVSGSKFGFKINAPGSTEHIVVWKDGGVTIHPAPGPGLKLGESPSLYRAILVARTQDLAIKVIEGA